MVQEEYCGIDIEEARKDRDSHEGGVGINWPEGDTNSYLLPRRPGYKVPYVEYAVHRVGQGQGQTVVCFNHKRNKILKNEKFLQLVADRGIEIPKSCKICHKVETEDLWNTAKEEAQRIAHKLRFVFLIIMWETRKTSKDDWQEISPKRVKPYFAAKKQWDEILDYISDMINSSGTDISNPDKAKLFKLHREGTKATTRYSAGPDLRSVTNPLSIPKEVRAIVAKTLADPEFEYEKFVADMVVPQDEIDALMAGVAIGEDEPVDDATGPKKCCGQPSLFNPNDPECNVKLCKDFDRCKLEVEALSKPVVKKADKVQEKAAEPPVDEAPPHGDAEAPSDEPAPTFESFEFTGTICSLCMKPQRALSGGPCCEDGHDNAPAWVAPAPAPAAPAAPAAAPAASKEAQASAVKTEGAAKMGATRLQQLLANRKK